MMTEKEKMMAGMWYDANNNQELIEHRLKAQEVLLKFNQTPLRDGKEIRALYKQLFNDDPQSLLEIMSLLGHTVAFILLVIP